MKGLVWGAALLILVVTGCTSVTVRPVDSASPEVGIRYSLPKPVLHVTPSFDGSVNVEVIFIPDPENTYAISSYTVLAAHSLEVMVSKGLLQKMGTVTDTTVVAADFVRAAGAVSGDVLKQEAVATEKRETNIAAARTALDTAETNLDAAEAKLAAMVKPEEIKTQEIVVAELKSRRDRAQVLLEREMKRLPSTVPTPGSFKASIQGSGITLEKLPAPTTAGDAAATMLAKTIGGAGKAKVWGALLYAVDEGVVGQGENQRPTVVLRPFEIRRLTSGQDGLNESAKKQQQFDTTSVPTVQIPKRDKTGVITVYLDDKNRGNFEIKTEYPIAELGSQPFVLKPSSQKQPAVALESGGKTVRVDVSGMNAGQYKIVIKFKYKTAEGKLESNDWVVQFRVERVGG